MTPASTTAELGIFGSPTNIKFHEPSPLFPPRHRRRFVDLRSGANDADNGFLVRSVRLQTTTKTKDGTIVPPVGKAHLYRYFVTEAQIRSSPAYASEADVEPSFSRSAAVQKASEWLRQRSPEPGNLLMSSCELYRLPNTYLQNRWYYLVQFVPQAKERESFAVMVLLDGTTIEPQITASNS